MLNHHSFTATLWLCLNLCLFHSPTFCNAHVPMAWNELPRTVLDSWYSSNHFSKVTLTRKHFSSCHLFSFCVDSDTFLKQLLYKNGFTADNHAGFPAVSSWWQGRASGLLRYGQQAQRTPRGWSLDREGVAFLGLHEADWLDCCCRRSRVKVVCRVRDAPQR